jgi:hypothetical protein
MISEAQEKKYLVVSPKMMRGGATLIHSNESLALYEAMDENTTKFAEDQIVNIIAAANSEGEEVTKALRFTIIFEGGFEDLPDGNGMNFVDFIKENADKMVAVYRYVKGERTEHYFVGIEQTETFYDYGYIYLRLGKLLKMFDENNVSYTLDIYGERYVPSLYADDSSTAVNISYDPNIKKTENNDVKKRTRKSTNK